MPSTTFSLSAALCLFLAVGPATILAAPQLNGLPVPILGGSNDDPAPATGNSEHDAGAGFAVGIPGGPGVAFGAGQHSEQHGPCGPGVSSEHNAGAGFAVGIPGGPGVEYGAGTHDQHEAVPCPEPVPVVVAEPSTTSTYVPVFIPPTYTTPIDIPTITNVPAYAPPSPVPVRSTPLIHPPAPSATPSYTPVYNAGSAMAPSALMGLALPMVLGFFY